MKIQQVEKQTGIPAQSIRYYEREGLIRPERNPENRYRTYSEADLERLETIAFCRRLGMSINDIRQLLAQRTSFRQCVEAALLEARAAEEKARATAELCLRVLKQLETCPDLTPQECTQVLLGAPHVRYLYEQVIPPENRQKKKRLEYFHVAYVFGVLTVILGMICAGLIIHIAATKSGRTDLLHWVGDVGNTLTLVYEDRNYAVADDPELDRKVGYMLLLGQPTQFVPGLRDAAKEVTLLVEGPDGQGQLHLYLQDDSVGMVWESPTGEFRATLVQHQAWVQLDSIIRMLSVT